MGKCERDVEGGHLVESKKMLLFIKQVLWFFFVLSSQQTKEFWVCKIFSYENSYEWVMKRQSCKVDQMKKIPNYESIASNSLKVIFRTKSSLTMKVQKFKSWSSKLLTNLACNYFNIWALNIHKFKLSELGLVHK